MRVRVLGTLRVGDVEVAGDRARLLLALLAAAPGRVVSAGALRDALWGDEPPANPVNALQRAVSRLRQLFADAGAAGALETADAGYRITGVATDAEELEALAGQARAVLAADPQRARDAAERALTLWGGPPFAEAGDHPALRPAARRLEELRLATLELRIDADLAAGRGPELVGELQQLSGAHPLRERFHAQLMIALYRAGRQTEALDVYQRLEATMREELGLDPGEELQTLQRAVLAHEPWLDAPTGTATTAAPLPQPLTTFVGRERETKEIADLLDAARLVTLVGPGGVGKTRLAVEAARASADRFTDGAVLVELAAHTEPEALLPHVAVAVGALPAIQTDMAVDPTSIVDRLRRRLRDRALLVVLDNCEHLLDAAAAVAETLLQAGARVTVLATSREGLRVPGERLWAVPTLTEDDAVELFVDRARAVQPRFALDADGAAHVASICRRLDGLPLAVELAAARAGAMTLADLAARLDDRFRLLVGGGRTAARRQQTLEAVVEWSHDLLDDDQRRVFRRLGVCTGGFEIAAAEAVATTEDVPAVAVLPILLDLVGKSLVLHDETTGRYGMLETLREFALRRLAASGEAEETRRRHLRWCEEFAAAAGAGVRGPEQVRWLERLEREHDNLRVALAWACEREPAAALALCCDLAWFWWLHLHRAEGVRWFDAALATADAPRGLRAEALAQRSLLAHFDGASAAALRPAVEEAVALLEDGLGDETATARTALITAFLVLESGDVARGLALTERAVTAAAAAGEAWVEAAARYVRGAGCLFAGDPAADAEWAAAIELAGEIGDRWVDFQARQMVAWRDRTTGRYDAAERNLRACLALGEELAIGDQVWALRADLGMLAMLAGDLDLARSRLRDVARRAPHPMPLGHAWHGLGMVERRAGDLAAAEAAYRQALTHFSGEADTPLGVAAAEVTAGLAHVAAARGDAQTAARCFAEAAALVRDRAQPLSWALVLEAGADAALAAGDPETAAARLGAATALRAALGVPLVAGERFDVDRLEEQIRAGVGVHADAALAAGAARDPADLLR